MNYNDRERLHQTLDKYLDMAEQKGHKLAFMGITGMTQTVKRAKKGIPAHLKLDLQTGIKMDSFAPEYRDSLNHLYDEEGRSDMAVMVLVGVPAKTLVDYQEHKAEQEAKERAAAGTEVTTP